MIKHPFAVVVLLVGVLGAPLTGMAHEAVDPLHATPVEIMKSRLATPKEIHVQEGAKGVEVRAYYTHTHITRHH